MPKKVSEADSKDKWNFYFPKLLKFKMHRKLLENNLQGKQSALLRALVILYVNDEVDNKRINELIESETYITPTNKISKL